MKTHYVLVEREGHRRVAVSREIAVDMVRRKLIPTANGLEPVTKARIKAERIHVYEDAWYYRHRAEDELQAKYHEKKFTAKVNWMRPGDGEGWVTILETGDSLPIYACNIKGTKTWYPETACVYYETGQVVDVECKVFAGGQVFVCGLTPGYFDADKWARLDQKRLAFKCDDNGNAINGLFATGDK
jgi:hypothetical protein